MSHINGMGPGTAEGEMTIRFPVSKIISIHIIPIGFGRAVLSPNAHVHPVYLPDHNTPAYGCEPSVTVRAAV